jgi:hypothetical protein
MIPCELRKGDRLTADWVNQLVREAVSRTLNAGPGLLKTQTPAGTTLSLAPIPRSRSTISREEETHPWQVLLSPSADGASCALSMVSGVAFEIGGGATIGIAWYGGATATASGYVGFPHETGASAPAFAVEFRQSLSSGFVPIAAVTKVGTEWRVRQYLTGPYWYLRGVEEEV